jgi:hypothetical protein
VPIYQVGCCGSQYKLKEAKDRALKAAEEMPSVQVLVNMSLLVNSLSDVIPLI